MNAKEEIKTYRMSKFLPKPRIEGAINGTVPPEIVRGFTVTAGLPPKTGLGEMLECDMFFEGGMFRFTTWINNEHVEAGKVSWSLGSSITPLPVGSQVSLVSRISQDDPISSDIQIYKVVAS